MNEAFLDRLDNLLLPQGFKRVGSEVYRRAWPGGFDAIVPMTVHYPGVIKLDFSLNIRHDAVELLLARVDPVTSGSGPHSPTTITHLGDMKRQGAVGDFHYRLVSPDALTVAMDDAAAFLRDAGEAHFRRLHDPFTVERTFNADPGVPCMHCRDEIRRVFRGLALARLYRPADLDRLVEAYREHCVKAWDPQRLVPRFEAVAAGLCERAP
jgi:hypothetical protein